MLRKMVLLYGHKGGCVNHVGYHVMRMTRRDIRFPGEEAGCVVAEEGPLSKLVSQAS